MKLSHQDASPVARPSSTRFDNISIETNADHFHQVFKTGGAYTNHCLRCLHNLALGLGWLSVWHSQPRLDAYQIERRRRLRVRNIDARNGKGRTLSAGEMAVAQASKPAG